MKHFLTTKLGQKLRFGWTPVRILYVFIGIIVAALAFKEQQWVGMVLGVGFALMGALGWGCAAASCSVPERNQPLDQAGSESVVFEEVKES
ncbi:MAG: hypothetical protein RMK52_04475 [Chitinophagales bacterium]|nr:hypothetical protein [Chitinophagales bacterium]MDW8393482.1 hypothetical protein [Chitinophagales bacterium]